jgi:hypothetical protein
MAVTGQAKTSGSISVLTTTTTVAAANQSRREITICNDHATQVVYLMLNTTDGTTVPTATASNGIRLNGAGGSWTTNSYKGPVAGISVGGTSVVTVVDI